MKKNKNTKQIEELLAELKAKETVEKSDAELLEILAVEIKRILDNSNDTKTSRIKRMLIDQLDTAVGHFEETHPAVASSMEKLIDMLNKMGI